MIKINEDQMDVFGHIQYVNLKSDIDKALYADVKDWKLLNSSQKEQWLDYLIEEANKIPLTSKGEYITFSLLCMTVQEGCESFLKRDDVSITLSDTFISNSRKLTLLNNFSTAQLTGN